LPAGPRPRVLEIGPGDGRLAEVVISALARSGIDCEYVLVERSEPLGRAALARATAAGDANRISVRRSPSVAAEGPFGGAVIANEVMDALPARRLRWTGDAWEELGVRLESDRLSAATVPIREPVPAPPLLPGSEPGTIVEFSSAAEAIVREVADHLTHGRFLILDYGMGEAELRSAHPRGTLEAIRQHLSVDDPLSAPGETDLSVFVNFDRIRAAARTAGWQESSFGSQAEALGAWGYPELFARAVREAKSSEEEVRLRLASKNLLFGFERFRVLELAVPAPGPP
ncbi:MAG: class I SAM-dependent methyltransferase, partial [Thermoplasmata archaeon]